MTTATRLVPAPALLPAVNTPRARLARGGGIWTLLLTLTLVLSMTLSVTEAAWADGMSAVSAAALVSTLLGFVLALTRWSGVFPVFYSFVASMGLVSRMVIAAMLPDLTLHDGVLEFIQRNVTWNIALFSGAPSADNLIFVTQLSFLAWWIGHFAIWSLIRHQRVLHAVIPAGIGLLVNTYYSPANLTGYLVLYLLAVLMLAIRVELARNEAAWQALRIRYAPDMYLDFLRSGFIFAVAVIALAWFMPGVANETVMERLGRPFEQPWKRLESTWQRMYRSLNYRAPAVQVTSYGRTMSFGGPVNLTDRPIFLGTTAERTYWRAAIFDNYTGTGWENTDADVLIVDRNLPLPEPPYSTTRTITTTIQSLEAKQDVIFGPPQISRVSLLLNADHTRLTDDRRLITVSMLRSRIAYSRDSTYQVVSRVSDAPIEALRVDLTDYPLWIEERFLQLPDNFPGRVRSLARRITAPFDNPFDKATAIEAELRKYKYNQNIAAPPAGADGVEYFLFGIREGYCDYYASAMAVMLRSVGIPTRIVTGYTPGQTIETPNPDPWARHTFRVLEQNAHAWVEVFFPTFGWIAFEPTASESLLMRPTARGPETAGSASGPLGSDRPDEMDDLLMDRGRPGGIGGLPVDPPVVRWLRRHWITLTVVTGLLALTACAVVWSRRERRVFFSAADLIGRLFGLLETWANRLNIPWPVSHTPLEHAAAFSGALPEAGQPVARITDVFVAQRYGRQEPSADTLSRSADDWRSLEVVFWKGWAKRIANLATSRFRSG